MYLRALCHIHAYLSRLGVGVDAFLAVIFCVFFYVVRRQGVIRRKSTLFGISEKTLESDFSTVEYVEFAHVCDRRKMATSDFCAQVT